MSTHETAASFRIARGFAVVTIIAVGVAAFVLSFASLRDLAILAHVPARWAWLFPVIVDGTIIQATVSALALAKSPERRWFTGVLVAGAVVSGLGLGAGGRYRPDLAARRHARAGGALPRRPSRTCPGR
jgi:hypothetical protein